MLFRATLVRTTDQGSFVNIPVYGQREFGPCDTDPQLKTMLDPGDDLVVSGVEDVDEDFVVVARVSGKIANVNHRLDQHEPPSGPLGLNGQRVINMAPGTAPNDAVTLAQVQEFLAAFEPGDSNSPSYEQQFVSPATVWDVPHGLGKKYVDVVLVDIFDNYIDGEIVYKTVDNFEVRFAIPVAGRVIANS